MPTFLTFLTFLTFPIRVQSRRWLGPALAMLLCFSFAPARAQEATEPVVAGPATVVSPDGEAVLLRAEPSYGAAVVASLAAGVPVEVVDGPIAGENGGAWVNVALGGQLGYLPSTAVRGGAAPAPEVEAPPAPSEPVPAPLAAEPEPTPEPEPEPMSEPEPEPMSVPIPDPPATAEPVEPAATVATIEPAEPTATEPVATIEPAEPTATEPVATAEPAEVVVEAEPVATVEPVAVTGETAVTTDAVNLRAEPSADAPVLLVVPSGAVVQRAGDVRDGFASVSYDGVTGWAAVAFLELGAGQGQDRDQALDATPEPAPAANATAEPTADPTATPSVEPNADPTSDPSATEVPVATLEAAVPPASGDATASALLNLRDGPSYDDAVLRVLPPGAPVTVTGAAAGGFLPVLYNGTNGWVDAAYLDTGGATTAPDEAAPIASEETPTASLAIGTATTTETADLRSGPSEAAPVEVVVPAGATLQTTGPAEDGFVPVSFADRTGWVAADRLTVGSGPGPAEGTPTETTPEPAATEAAEAAAPDAGSGLIWPVAGGSWEILQGYNGSSHQNQDGLWQYYYSLDLVRADGGTAGQPVLSPASGTVRWTDPSSGGISIDIGGGHAVALYHVAVDPNLAWGDPVAQGQAIGTVSGPGGPGFAGTPHVHLALWETTDGGNWSRSAAPFVGPYGIAGQEFPDTGGGNQHRGTTFTP